jgi:transposase
MLAIPSQVPIYIAIQPIDFRKGIDGLQQLCQQRFNHDAFNGAIFIFCNKCRHSIKILWYDGQGFILCLKRLSKGKFKWWPQNNADDNYQLYQALAQEVQILLWNGMPQLSQCQPLWRPNNIHAATPTSIAAPPVAAAANCAR